jgi:hypothetical protein
LTVEAIGKDAGRMLTFHGPKVRRVINPIAIDGANSKPASKQKNLLSATITRPPERRSA